MGIASRRCRLGVSIPASGSASLNYHIRLELRRVVPLLPKYTPELNPILRMWWYMCSHSS